MGDDMARIHYRLWSVCVMMLLTVAFSIAQAAPSVSQIQQLPPSFGENQTESLPGNNWVDFGIREHVGYEHLEFVPIRAGSCPAPPSWCPDGESLRSILRTAWCSTCRS